MPSLLPDSGPPTHILSVSRGSGCGPHTCHQPPNPNHVSFLQACPERCPMGSSRPLVAAAASTACLTVPRQDLRLEPGEPGSPSIPTTRPSCRPSWALKMENKCSATACKWLWMCLMWGLRGPGPPPPPLRGADLCPRSPAGARMDPVVLAADLPTPHVQRTACSPAVRAEHRSWVSRIPGEPPGP